MTIDKAIEILKELHALSHDGKDPDWRGAIKLGIEALKLIKLTHEHSGMSFGAILPGETRDTMVTKIKQGNPVHLINKKVH